MNNGPFKTTNGSIIAEFEICTGPFESSITTFSISENELLIFSKKISILLIHCQGY